MPRRQRIHIDAVPLHIVQRGHNRQPCFFAEEDYHIYLHWLSEALRKEHCALHKHSFPVDRHACRTLTFIPRRFEDQLAGA